MLFRSIALHTPATAAKPPDTRTRAGCAGGTSTCTGKPRSGWRRGKRRKQGKQRILSPAQAGICVPERSRNAARMRRRRDSRRDGTARKEADMAIARGTQQRYRSRATAAKGRKAGFDPKRPRNANQVAPGAYTCQAVMRRLAKGLEEAGRGRVHLPQVYALVLLGWIRDYENRLTDTLAEMDAWTP